MCPACRTIGDALTMPPCALTPGDVAGFTDDLQACRGLWHAWVPRSAPRAHGFDALVGPWRPLARTSIEPRALRLPGGSGRGWQRFLREVPWDEAQRQWIAHQRVGAERGEPEGILLGDAPGLVTKGTDAVGVARQDGGTLGTVEHGQVGGCAGSAARQGAARVEKHLVLPEAWVTDADAARRPTWQVPPELPWPSTPPLQVGESHWGTGPGPHPIRESSPGMRCTEERRRDARPIPCSPTVLAGTRRRLPVAAR